MKATTLQSRIEKNLTTKSGKIAGKYFYVIYMVENPTTTDCPVKWVKSGRHLNLIDRSGNLIEGLTKLGIDFETGNDAPRGGKDGFFVRLTKKGKNQVKAYNEFKISETARIKAEAEAARIARIESVSKSISDLPVNESFEAKWDSVELKDASGLSWSGYREMLKASHPDEWSILKAKFKLQQSK